MKYIYSYSMLILVLQTKTSIQLWCIVQPIWYMTVNCMNDDYFVSQSINMSRLQYPDLASWTCMCVSVTWCSEILMRTDVESYFNSLGQYLRCVAFSLILFSPSHLSPSKNYTVGGFGLVIWHNTKMRFGKWGSWEQKREKKTHVVH